MSTLMDAKSKKSKLDKKKRKDPFSFISELKEELKKVSWTTKTELVSATKIVIISIFCFGIGIYAVDLVVKGLLELIKRTLLFIFG
ncbi:MAG: preprotein translocase subunit SecE [Simkaniaceae bacterium]|nr:preprotein translocase subunit SecE [Candidatus Sacchlamyda saccharinae]